MAGKRSGRSDGDPADDSPENPPANESELRSSPNKGVAIIAGRTFGQRSIVYYEVDGMALVEGDIALGPVARIQQVTDAMQRAAASGVAFSVAIQGNEYRWPNCVMPYEIDPALPNPQRVTDAIAHWEANTSFRFPQRTAANAAQYPNYVRFLDAGGCWSLVGMQGGQQDISLGPGCTAGNAIHEIGHAVGLWHEQSREDRDLFVTINWQNIKAGMSAQFDQHIVDGDDIGPYDYASIMHYPRDAFSKNGQDTITPTDANAQIGQRERLSPGDIAAVRELYPNCGAIKPPASEPIGGIKKLRDDQVVSFKKLRDDIPFKKLRDDIVGKAPRDPKPAWDPGPIKGARDPRPIGRPGIIGQPGIMRPFSMVTPHHAPNALGMNVSADAADLLSYVTALEQQLLEIEAAIAQNHALAAQANAEVARLQEASRTLLGAYDEAMDQLGGAG